jgi:hypothetical protein
MRNYNLIDFNVNIQIPHILTENIIYENQPKSEIYVAAKIIFYELKIPHENLVIKKYSNCILINFKNVSLIWYFTGKKYLGGWQN